MIAAERTWPDAEEFEEVLKNLLFKIFIFDCDTLKFLWASEECLRHLGYTRGELIRMTPLKVYPDLKIEGFSRILLPLVTHQKDKVHIETVYRRHDGAVFPVELQISLTEIAGRHAFVGIVFDISDRKDARHDAARLGEMLRAVLKLPVAFFRLDEHGHVTESLGEGLEHVGFKGEDVLGANVFEKWPEYADAFRRVLAGGSTHFELRHAADNGEILLQNYLTFDKVHERGAIGIAVDISERKRIEEAGVVGGEHERAVIRQMLTPLNLESEDAEHHGADELVDDTGEPSLDRVQRFQPLPLTVSKNLFRV